MKKLNLLLYLTYMAMFVSQPVLAEIKEQYIFAAASVKNGLKNVLKNYSKKTRIVYASSGIVAKQIHRGAPANIFISANKKWIYWLIEKGHLLKSNIFPLMETSLIIAKKLYNLKRVV